MAGQKFFQITPFMHVPDLEAALDWFALLGFAPAFRQWNYAYVTRGGVSVRVLESRDSSGAPFPGHGGFACYIDVDDVDVLHAEIAPRLRDAGIRFEGPRDQEYLQRELMIAAPDGNTFVFGMAIPKTEDG